MLKRIAECISRYSMFDRGQSVGVAVSGGADSTALLHLLAELAPQDNLSLIVLHLNHHLRGEQSDADARFVSDLAETLRLPVIIEDADLAGPVGNLEQAARRTRRDFFLRAMRRERLDRVALGHTRSDQAETVLFRLLRGAGPSGLAGIYPVTREGFVRPLIETDRAEVIQFLVERNLTWRDDASNRDYRFARNRIRRQLLPTLTSEWNPNLSETLAHLASITQDEERFWEAEIARLDLLVHRPPAVLIDVSRLDGLHPALLRRLLRRAIAAVRGDLRRIDYQHIDQVLRLLTQPAGDGRFSLPGLEACRSFQWLRFAPPGLEPPAFRIPLQVPGDTAIPGGQVRLVLRLVRPALDSGYNKRTDLDWDKVSGPFELRTWEAGDRFRPAGESSARKLKDLFQRARIPLWERSGWPMITSGDSVIWVRGFGPAAEIGAGPQTRCLLRVLEQ